MNSWQYISKSISQQTGSDFQIDSHISVGGGCINEAYRVSNGKSEYFVKTNHLKHGDMFETEALSLKEMFDQNTVRVPEPVCYGQTDTITFLVLEYLPLTGRFDATLLGQQLAAMHQVTQPQFGWQRDNTIGSTPQRNRLTSNWIEFWRQQRLLPQLKLAQKNGYGAALNPLMDKLLQNFDCLYDSYTPQPSLLHGDLWGGNASALADATPVIFDPALYYGDREADIAMTQLFGGFPADFYSAYNDISPLDEGFAVRKTFYNLYHILNHLNLFGEGYLNQAISMAERVLAEI
ncbi:MAG: fructosamine kinase family protein [Gammaproteobacteria bacterium]|nr:fructosamine kinase family protein [Gammaproteobacteria bacterium]